MTITATIVIFATIWFLALLVFLPIGLRSQAEDGEIVPGTPASAPINAMIRRKAIWATWAAVLITTPLCALIIWGGITVRGLDIWRVM